jgi:hypothetical protein
MRISKKDRDQVIAITEDELNISNHGGPYSGKYKVRRVWREGGSIVATFEQEDEAFLRNFAKSVGGHAGRRRQTAYDIDYILSRKQERFGSGSIGYS